MSLRQAAQQALDALERVMSHGPAVEQAKEALRAALAEPAIEVLVQRAVEAEREACAKVCDARFMGDHNREDMEAKRCAAAIRCRT